MTIQLFPVDRDNRFAHDRPKVQQDALSGPMGGDRKAPAVQQLLPGFGRLFRAGQQAFRAEGHQDLPGPAAAGHLPGPVQAEPLVPDHLRAGIAVPGDFRQGTPFGGVQSLHTRLSVM